MEPSSWNKDALPEFIWIDAIASSCDWPRAVSLIQETLDVLDDFYPTGAREIIDGTLSSFALIPEDRRDDALTKWS